MDTRTGSEPWRQLWRLLVVTPSGMPEVIEVRAASEQSAVDRVAHWRPEWTIRSVERRPGGA